MDGGSVTTLLDRHLMKPLSIPVQRLGQSVRTYNVRRFRADLLAGLTVAVVEVPQAMAYAVIAGVDPRYGLYTSIVQGLIGALFSSNDHLASGPTNTQSLLVAAAVSRLVAPGNGGAYLQLVIALTLIKGLIQLAFAAARMGGLVRYVSHSVIIGFTAGAGVLIAVGQIPNFLGLDLPRAAARFPGVLGTIQQMTPHLDEVNLLAVGLGAGALAIVLVARWISKLLPGPLLAVVIPAALVYGAGWTHGELKLIGELPQALPEPDWPALDWRQAEALLSGAFALALLGMIETVGIAKAIASRTGERISPNQEFFTQGLANVVGSFLQNIPGSGSFTRSALNFTAGGATRFAGVFNSLFVAAIFLLFAPQARYIPLTTLAAILFVVAYSLIDWRYIFRIVRTSRSDTAVCLITFASALLMPLAYAIYVGIFLNIALYLRRASQLHLAEMVQSPGGPFVERPMRDRTGEKKVMFLQVEGDLFFGVADELQERLSGVAHSGVRVVILRLKRTHSIDSTVLTVFEQFVQEMHSRQAHVLLCGVRPTLLQRLRDFGLVQLIGEQNVFETGYGVFTSAKRAIHRARQLVGSSIDVDHDLMSDDETEGWAYEI